MSEDSKRTLPSLLIDLLEPTPTGTAKLLSAWDGLTMESQMQVLFALNKTEHPEHLSKKILVKALESPNGYIRYLACNKIPWGMIDDGEERALKERIYADVDPLVKYCLSDSGDITNPQSFFLLPQEARLARVRHLGVGSGEKLASLITYALERLMEHGEVSEIELEEIVTDYLVRPSFKKQYEMDDLRYDGFIAHRAGNDMDALWNLVPRVTEKISYVLLTHLPEQAGLNQGIPQGVLDQLTSNQLITLLDRRDIGLWELRKTIFNKPGETSGNSGDLVRSAAISWNFSLTYAEFSNILKKPEKEKVSVLRDLTHAEGLRLVFYQVLHDILVKSDIHYWEEGEPAKIRLDRKTKQVEELAEWEKKSELTQLKLYTLAKEAVLWDESKKGHLPEKPLEFLAPLTVKVDTWQTFMNYSEVWNKYNNDKLYKHLPFIPAFEDRAEHTKELESKSALNQPLSGKEFYNFHFERRVNLISTIIFGCFALAFFFVVQTVWGFFSGDQETLWRDIGLVGGLVLAGFLFLKVYNDLFNEKKVNEEKEV